MGEVLDVRGEAPPAAALERARAVLAGGGVVGVPTDTVYGLAALPTSGGGAPGTGSAPGTPAGTAAIFRLKGRPADAALPVLVADAGQARALAEVGPAAGRLMAAFWPGALTVVVTRAPGVHLDLGGDERTVGLRAPAHPVPLALCRLAGPIATTSANRHGEPPMTLAAQLARAFPGVLVLDAGPCDGAPSTVVDCTGGEVRLLRAGAVAWEDIARVAEA